MAGGGAEGVGCGMAGGGWSKPRATLTLSRLAWVKCGCGAPAVVAAGREPRFFWA